jgi:Flp pilus assembly protein TadD
VILTARLYQQDGRSSAEFRAAAAESRLPKSEGVVVSVEDGEVAIDLGSVDGLERGAVVRLFRGAGAATPVGTVTIARVFRQRATGVATPAGSPQAGDRAELAPATQVAAVVDQVGARIAAGDTTAARTLAERAVSMSQSSAVPADLRRRALAQLGTLEHRAGVLDAAERHLRSAVDSLASVPAATGEEGAEVQNELGAVLIERGNRDEAESVLRRAQAGATGAAGVHVTNNLAALAALRGDLATAATMYRAALAMAGSSRELASDRRAIERNLVGLTAAK